ncbi:hypothetical protein C8F04DRAFT_190439 [Mycena alexandri]|uniref:T6SS Phospholipase effector Tle1-like catalytic domain-containing protein n=1 Tax=Mycena alexandri TaxID=1745969 RepID=A0AAD6S8K2_9AGAR|nr:hypothetical protein C8F04DRAFT_190439 [Mycena alexandri]
MATAFVSGIIANMISLHGDLPPIIMRDKLIQLSVKDAVQELKPDTFNRIARGCIHSQLTLKIDHATRGTFAIEQDCRAIVSSVRLSRTEEAHVNFQDDNRSVDCVYDIAGKHSLDKFVLVSGQRLAGIVLQNGLGTEGAEGEIIAEFCNWSYRVSGKVVTWKTYFCLVGDTPLPTETQTPATHKPKRLFVFCDGTGQDGIIAPEGPTQFLNSSQAFEHGIGEALSANLGKPPSSDAPYVTNVLRLARAVKRYSSDDPHDEDRMPQIVFYQSGVGAEADFRGNILQPALFTQANGWGVAYKIRDAYGFIAENFEAGDEIFLFGFSRGAFTARKLAQLIDKIGVLETETLGLFFPLWKELVDGKTPVIPSSTRAADIKCLGVWDTVAAVDNTPTVLHLKDSVLPANVKNAFHAVSIQENRKEFRPTLFKRQPGSTQNLKEYWFPGAHSDVGGSYERQELADISLFWMTGEILGVEKDGHYPNQLFNLDTEFLERSKQKAPRDDWGTSAPHNAYEECWMRLIIYTPMDRLASGDITASAKWHLSLKSAPIDPSHKKFDHRYMITQQDLEKKFGKLKCEDLNAWEAHQKDKWQNQTNEPPVVYDDPRVLFPDTPELRWMTLAEVEASSNTAALHIVPLCEHPAKLAYAGKTRYESSEYPGHVLSDKKTIYIIVSGKKVVITEGVKLLIAPKDAVAWLRIRGKLTSENLRGQTPVIAGYDDQGNPRYPRSGSRFACNSRRRNSIRILTQLCEPPWQHRFYCDRLPSSNPEIGALLPAPYNGTVQDGKQLDFSQSRLRQLGRDPHHPV